MQNELERRKNQKGLNLEGENMSKKNQIAKFKKAVKACKGKTRTAFRSCMRTKLSKRK